MGRVTVRLKQKRVNVVMPSAAHRSYGLDEMMMKVVRERKTGARSISMLQPPHSTSNSSSSISSSHLRKGSIIWVRPTLTYLPTYLPTYLSTYLDNSLISKRLAVVEQADVIHIPITLRIYQLLHFSHLHTIYTYMYR